ncbi:hypothetical protein HPG69_016395, partial [Diceros bicornis minor]
MPSSPTLIFMGIFFLESFTAMLQNVFMVAVLGRKWVRCHTLPAGDMIVACLASSRFCLHGMALLNNLLVSINFSSIVYYFNIPWEFINILTYWLTAWLAVFYCHPGAKQPQAEKGPEDDGLESPGEKAIHLELSKSVTSVDRQTDEWQECT